MRERKSELRGMLLAGLVFVLGGVFYRLGHTANALINVGFSVLSNACYVGLIFVWGDSLKRRIIRADIRTYLIVCCALMVFWVFVRFGKYHLFPANEGLKRRLWYCYYITIVYAPLLGFLAALRLGLPDAGGRYRRWNLLFIPATLLVIGIMTNDAHQLAFRFAPDFAEWDSQYEHRVLYFAAFGWTLVMLLMSVAVITRRCRVADSRRLAWVPMVVLTLGVAFTEFFFASRVRLFEVTECVCLTFAATWESCFQIGIMPSNRDHGAFFLHSGLSARIVNAEGQTVYRAQPEAPAAKEDLRLNREAIRGGAVEWEDDLETIHRLNARLQDIQEQLNEQAELTRAENAMKEKRARVEEKNRLYDRIGRFVQPRLSGIREELARMSASDPDFARRLTAICVKGAYIKRRSNLMLLSEKNSELSSEELVYSLRESLEYLSMEKGGGSLTVSGAGRYEGRLLIAAYDGVEAALEAQTGASPLLMVHLSCEEDGFSLRTVTEAPYPLPEMEGQASVERSERDDVCYTTLRFFKEVEAA